MLEGVDTVVGYGRYVELLGGLVTGKEVVTTAMTGERDRCEQALRLAGRGRRVALVSSGDAGIYAMAGLVLELLAASGDGGPAVEVVPGVPAFVAAAALLGAPLMHDFASISLSDLLTPWETIERRIEAAAAADFVIALYNPKSRGRVTQLPRSMEIVARHRAPSTPVGVVKNASRPGETVTLTTLGGVGRLYDSIDMSTLLIIGNSTTYEAGGRMITPRGYDVAGAGKDAGHAGRRHGVRARAAGRPFTVCSWPRR